jgi:hypothetical protein
MAARAWSSEKRKTMLGRLREPEGEVAQPQQAALALREARKVRRESVCMV